MLNPSTEQVGYIAIANYNSVKDFASHTDKDILFSQLLFASCEQELNDSDVSICERHNEIVDTWVSLQNTKRVCKEALDVYLLSFYPKAYNLITLSEFILLRNIQQLSPDNIRLGVLYSLGSYELWIICKTRDYDLLDQVSGLVVQYEGKSGKTINCVWATEEKMQIISQPEFIFTL